MAPQGFVLATLAALLVAGCTNSAHPLVAPHWIDAAAADGYLLLDSATYDNNSVLQFDDGFVRIHVDPGRAVGQLEAHGRIDGRLWTVVMRDFGSHDAAPWQASGITTNVTLFGSSGHGGPELPTVIANLAGWGSANLTILTAESEKVTTKWQATFALIKDGVRNDDRRAIYGDPEGKTYYTPTRPDAAAYENGHPELHLRLRSSSSQQGPPTSFDFDGPAPRMVPYPVTTQQSFFFNNSVIPARLNLTVLLSGSPAGYGYYEFSLRAPGKQNLGTWTYSTRDQRPVGQPTTTTVSLPLQNLTLHQLGRYELHVYSYGDVGVKYHLHGLMSGLEPEANFWFDQTAMGKDAGRLEARDPAWFAAPRGADR